MNIINNFWKDTTTSVLPGEIWKDVGTIRGRDFTGLYAVWGKR